MFPRMSMKKPSLTALLCSATLFLGGRIWGQTPAPTAAPVASPSVPASDNDEVAQREAELLRRFDKNHDGKLDDEETAAAHEAMREEASGGKPGAGRQGRSGTGLQKLALQMFDANHNGKLDPDEQLAAQKYFAKTGLAAAIREEVLARFDRDGDGRLDAEERAAAAKYSQEHPGELRRAVLLRLFDKNGDGKLDAEERATMQAVLRPPSLGGRNHRNHGNKGLSHADPS